MAEYRIVAKVDPQTAAGSNKVKQDLRGIQTEANATESALNRSFDQAKFDKTIGGLVGRLDQLDKKLSGASTSASQAGKGFDAATGSLDRMTAAEFRAAGGLDGLNRAERTAATGAAQMEAALRRVLQAVDAGAAEQMRMNALLVDAKRLLDANKISLEQYNRVQQMAVAVGKEQVVQTGAQRIGMQQLGFQLGDVATMWSLGAKPAQIFGSQIGQVTQALQLMSNGTNKFLSIMAGPWGVAISVALIVLAPFIGKLLEGNDALGDAVEKLKADARETELAARAKEAYARTIEGVTAAIREQNKELKESLQTQRDVLMQQMTETRVRLATIQARREDAAQALQDARDLYEFQKQRASGPGQSAEIAALGLERARQRVVDAEQAYNSLAGTVATAEENIRRADAAFASNAAERAVDPIQRLNDEYDRQKRAMIEAAVASENFSAPALAREIAQLEQRRARAIEAAQAQDRLNRSTAQGVATFRSQEQAIGIAGRELQQVQLGNGLGLDVSGNRQFRVTTGHANDAQHNRTAIDVNASAQPGRATGGINEASVPDIRARFDALARRYQARGYKVLWNGHVWPAGGNGPGPAITGRDKHYDHMHLEAPTTIVGRATGASTESQIRRDEQTEANAAARVQERADDFVAGIVNQAASRGLSSDRRTQLGAAIDEAFAEFERRFERAPDFGEKWKIMTALTEADAREVEQSFQRAYVDPLKRLQDLQGKTGLDRQVMNAKLDETLRLGRELTPVENEMIENGIRQGDQLSRQAQLLEQIQAPLENYRALLETLNALLARGEISQASYNARIAELANTAAQTSFQGLSGVDPATGRTYDDISAITDENARYAKQLEDFQNHREQLLQLGIDYNALEEAAARQHQENLAQIDQARKEVSLNAISDMAGSMTSIMKSMFGEQSRLYKAAFAAEKAVAIARSIIAIQTGIAQAAALPFPANLPAIASVIAATASIVSNIQAVALNFRDGGYVRGPGGPRSDSVPANLSNGEFVVNAKATAGNRALLEAINSGREVRQVGRANAAETARQTVAAMPAVNVSAPPAEVRVINVNDPRAALAALGTAEGTQTIMNMMESNPTAFRRVLGAN